MHTTCPDCGSMLLARRQGSSYSLRCSSCCWTIATTFPHPFDRDRQIYTLIVSPLGGNMQGLVVLNRRFSHGIARTRELFAKVEQPLKTGTARAIWDEAIRLRAEGIAFRIEPEFPYDFDDPELEPGFSYDWRPVNEKESTPGIQLSSNELKAMEVLVYEPGGRFLAEILSRDPSTFRLVCPVCGADVIFAPTRELARKYKMHPGAHCSRDTTHLTALYELKNDG